MILTDKLHTPGDYPFVFTGLVGQLEAVLTVPAIVNKQYIALLGHPHSLQGGTMNNKVVTTMARAFKELAILSLRFNFRGVGNSQGEYDAGIGESEDMLALMRYCQQEVPNVRFIFAGFSFGSYVAYRAAAQCAHSLLITIAPPINHYNYREFTPPNPWLIMQGDDDEVIPAELVHHFAAEFSPPLPVYRFAATGHFFHGQLTVLKDQLISGISAQVAGL